MFILIRKLERILIRLYLNKILSSFLISVLVSGWNWWMNSYICNFAFAYWKKRGCPRGVMVKAMDNGIVVSEFVLQSRYYVHFRANTLGKGIEPPYPPGYGLDSTTSSRRMALAFLTYKGWYAIKQRKQTWKKPDLLPTSKVLKLKVNSKFHKSVHGTKF